MIKDKPMPVAKKNPASISGRVRGLLDRTDERLTYIECAERLGIDPRRMLNILGHLVLTGQCQSDTTVKPARYFRREKS